MSEIKFTANSLQILKFEISSLTSVPLNQETISTVTWRMGKFGTYDVVLEKTTLDDVTVNGTTITVVLNGEDTINLYGLFRHQLTIVDINSNSYVIDEGNITIGRYIQ
jgi:hypothetical protein